MHVAPGSHSLVFGESEVTQYLGLAPSSMFGSTFLDTRERERKGGEREREREREK